MTSEVAGNVKAISLKFEWEIDNFCTRCKNVGDLLQSPKFTADSNNSSNIQWHLLLYPKGKTEKFKDHLALYLKSNAEVKAVGIFIIFNNEGKVMVKQMNEHLFTGENSWGYGDFISRDFVTNPVNGILNDDKLKIVCKITYKNTNQELKKQEDDVLPRLKDDYEALLNDSTFSDVTLISEGKEIKVHKCILAKRSSVFAAMFSAEMKEKQGNSVEINDINYDVLVEMCRFIYSGKINNIDTLAGELAVAADKYALDRLKTLCEKTMRKNVNLENVIDCIQLADRLRMVKLKESAIEFIVKNAREISNKPEFDLLPRDIVCMVFRCLANKYT